MPVKLLKEKPARKTVRGKRQPRGRETEAPLGWLQGKIVKKIDQLGDEASGYSVLQALIAEGGWVDPSKGGERHYESSRDLPRRRLVELD